jgi:hypothetical protein
MFSNHRRKEGDIDDLFVLNLLMDFALLLGSAQVSRDARSLGNTTGRRKRSIHLLPLVFLLGSPNCNGRRDQESTLGYLARNTCEAARF